jgi:hypothetical protein
MCSRAGCQVLITEALSCICFSFCLYAANLPACGLEDFISANLTCRSGLSCQLGLAEEAATTCTRSLNCTRLIAIAALERSPTFLEWLLRKSSDSPVVTRSLRAVARNDVPARCDNFCVMTFMAIQTTKVGRQPRLENGHTTYHQAIVCSRSAGA